jgi:hypothetical protein
LTKQTDRLPALSGLAKRVLPLLGDYLAGMWSDTLVSDLMWRVNKLDCEFGRPVNYTGPSWSWASINGPVSYWQDLKNKVPFAVRDTRSKTPLLIEKSRSIAVSCNVQAAGKNPFGEIASGALDITAHLKEARLIYVYTRSGHGFSALRDLEVDPLKYELEIPETKLQPSTDLPFPTDHVLYSRDEELQPYIKLPFFADYVLSKKGPRGIPHNALIYLALVHPYVCLVLRVVEPSQFPTNRLTFQRIGIVKQQSLLPNSYYFDWMSVTKRTSI